MECVAAPYRLTNRLFTAASLSAPNSGRAYAAETEFEFFLSSLRLLDNWLARGFFQLFEAVLTLELSRSTAQGTTDFHRSLRLYRIVAGTSLLACSALYILGGILCWGRHKARGDMITPPWYFASRTCSLAYQIASNKHQSRV